MKVKLYFVTFLFLLPVTVMAQEATRADEIRSSDRYRNTLRDFQEPEIFPASGSDVEIYRIFIIPTFSNPLSIRVEQRGSEYFLIAKRLSGQGGYGWGTVRQVKERRLSRREWQTLLNLLNQASFWTLPVNDERYEENERGEVTICLDGATWFLEGVRGGSYHTVNRYCPESESFEAIGLYMVRMSRLGIRRRALY